MRAVQHTADALAPTPHETGSILRAANVLPERTSSRRQQVERANFCAPLQRLRWTLAKVGSGQNLNGEKTKLQTTRQLTRTRHRWSGPRSSSRDGKISIASSKSVIARRTAPERRLKTKDLDNSRRPEQRHVILRMQSGRHEGRHPQGSLLSYPSRYSHGHEPCLGSPWRARLLPWRWRTSSSPTGVQSASTDTRAGNDFADSPRPL